MTPLLRVSKGRIINTTSSSVYMTIPMASAYPTSEAALKTFTRHLRMELAPFGIEVTSLEPGGVETAMAEMGPEVEARQWASIPEPLREQYRRHFLSRGHRDRRQFHIPAARCLCRCRMGEGHLCEAPATFVSDRASKVAVLPWLHRLLPAQQVENIWRRMFSRKRGA